LRSVEASLGPEGRRFESYHPDFFGLRAKKIESRWEKVESRRKPDRRIGSSNAQYRSDAASYFLPSTRSTFYPLLSWLFGCSAFHRPMTFAFEKLMVYQKSVDFADRVCSITSDFSARYNFLADQLNRAALSISSNIAEGNGRFTKADQKSSLESRAIDCWPKPVAHAIGQQLQ